VPPVALEAAAAGSGAPLPGACDVVPDAWPTAPLIADTIPPTGAVSTAFWTSRWAERSWAWASRTISAWACLPDVMSFVADRFAGKEATSNC